MEVRTKKKEKELIKLTHIPKFNKANAIVYYFSNRNIVYV